MVRQRAEASEGKQGAPGRSITVSLGAVNGENGVLGKGGGSV